MPTTSLCKLPWPCVRCSIRSAAATLTYAGRLQLPVAAFANLAPWFERVVALDAWQKTQPAI